MKNEELKEQKDIRLYIVYKHTNKINGKIYIGITCQKPENRWRKGKGYNKGTYIYNALEKYGWDNFEHEILFEGLTEIEARKKESELIKQFRCNEETFGYNLTEGGEHNIPNQVIRDKISKTNKAKMTSERRQQHREIALKLDYNGERNPFFGKHHDESTRKRMSENHWSKKQPEIFKDIFCNKKGKNNPSAKKVVRLIDGKIYDTMLECASDNNFQLDTISYHCKKRYHNNEFMYYSEYCLLSKKEQQQLKEISEDRQLNPTKYNAQNKKVIDLKNNVIYNSIKECHEKTGNTQATIINNCKGKFKTQKFMYLSDYELKYNILGEMDYGTLTICSY